MFYIIIGGSGSGKSEYAESVAVSLGEGKKKYYIATMEPFGAETKKKIKRHQEMRKDKGFETIEKYRRLEEVASEYTMKDSVVLLECLSNLTGNELYTEQDPKTAIAHMKQGIEALTECCSHLIIVTNEVCADEEAYSEEMVLYRKVFSEINQWAAAKADQVVEVVCGIPTTCRMDVHEGGNGMKLIIGGAYQGQQEWAKRKWPEKRWVDGATCEKEELFTCGGIQNFHLFIKREMEKGIYDRKELIDAILERNPELIVVADENGSGLVPIDPFRREYREEAGRTLTALAENAENVYRLIMGIAMKLK